MLENVIVTIILTIAGVFLSYWILILGLVHLGHKTIEDAKAKVSEWMSNIYIALDALSKKSQLQQVYPVYIGSNGYSIREDVIHKHFENIGKYFEIWYFEYAYSIIPNTVTYQFRVYNQIDTNFSRSRIMSICRQIAEKSLVQHFHENGIYNISPDNFVAVSWQGDILQIYFAINNDGFKEIAELRKKSH